MSPLTNTGWRRRALGAEAALTMAIESLREAAADQEHRGWAVAQSAVAVVEAITAAAAAETTPDERLIAGIRRRHWETPDYRGMFRRRRPNSPIPPSGRCACGSGWPCDAKRLLDLLDRIEAERMEP